jgi:hypothetical protein
VSVATCSPEAGYVDNALDCNDSSATNYPGSTEICDYVDNNCDGDIDEGLRPTCGVGLCRRVSEICGPETLCSPGDPLVEGCNGLDDDCDGQVDEEGCPDGQGCFDNECVALSEIPTSPGATSTAESSTREEPPAPSNTSGPNAQPPPHSNVTGDANSEPNGGSFPNEPSTSGAPAPRLEDGGGSCHVGRAPSVGPVSWMWVVLSGAGWVLWYRRRNALVQSR